MEKHYENMRYSGALWIGEIPSHWKIIRMKNLFMNISEKNHPDAEVLSLYREYGVLPKNSRDDNYNVTSEDTSSYKYVRKGDLVINKMKAWQGSLAISDYEGIVSPAYYVCRFVQQNISKRYYHYLLRCKTYAQEYERLSTGMRIGQWDLGIDDFMRIPVLKPPIEEQKRIAEILDRYCLRIEEIITEAKANVEDLKKWRTSIIFEAVTEGLNKSVAMKKCSIEGIEKIPTHWVEKSIKNISTYNDEVLTEATDPMFEFDYIDIGSVKYGEGITDVQRMIFGEAPSRARRIVKKGDVIISSVRTYLKAVAVIDEEEIQQIASTGFVVLRANRIEPRFLYYAVLSDRFICAVEANSTGMSYPAISASRLVSFKIPVPPAQEQKEISEFLDDKCEKIEDLIKEKEELITDLEKYKKSLIFEIVTGKRRVV